MPNLLYTYIYIYIYVISWATIVENNPKAAFSIATTPRCWEGHYSFPWLAPLTPTEWLDQASLVVERTSYFCLARKLIWPLWSTHIFTQWGWLNLFSLDNFSGQHQTGEKSPNTLFPRSFGYVDCDAKFHPDIQLLHPWATFSRDIHASLPKQTGPHIHGQLHHSCS